jgi:hypothetical protein
MKPKEQIDSYWVRINQLEERIQELARKGVSYSLEMGKRKSLLMNVRRLMKQEKEK